MLYFFKKHSTLSLILIITLLAIAFTHIHFKVNDMHTDRINKSILKTDSELKRIKQLCEDKFKNIKWEDRFKYGLEVTKCETDLMVKLIGRPEVVEKMEKRRYSMFITLTFSIHIFFICLCLVAFTLKNTTYYKYILNIQSQYYILLSIIRTLIYWCASSILWFILIMIFIKIGLASGIPISPGQLIASTINPSILHAKSTVGLEFVHLIIIALYIGAFWATAFGGKLYLNTKHYFKDLLSFYHLVISPFSKKYLIPYKKLEKYNTYKLASKLARISLFGIAIFFIIMFAGIWKIIFDDTYDLILYSIYPQY